MTIETTPSGKSSGAGAWHITRLRLAKVVIDVISGVIAVLAAFVLRFDGSLPDGVPVLLAIVVSLALKTIPYVLGGLHRRSWSNLTFRDLGGLLGLGAFVAVVGTL